MPTTPAQQAIQLALANPTQALQYLDKIDAETSLLRFIRLLWPILEPSRAFIEGWAINAICEHLEAITKGQIKRLLINVPPGCMKSLTTNVFWPAWEWGPRNLPSTRYVSASYAEQLTVRDNRRGRNLLLAPIYQALWGDRFKLLDEQNAKVRYDNDKTGFRIATSVGGMGTGERGDRFIVDDPHNVKETESDLKRGSALQWFTEVVPTRINSPENSAIIVIMQRVHQDDISGIIIEKELGYVHLNLPMEYEQASHCRTVIGFNDPRTAEGQLLWPEQFSARYLESDLKPSLRAWGGEYAIAGQLQQRPAPRGGGMFPKDKFTMVPATPGRVLRRVRGWDLAATASGRAAHTVGLRLALLADGRLCIENIVRAQVGPHEVDQLIANTARSDGTSVEQSFPQDPGQAGKAQKAHLAAKLHGYRIHFSLESGAKEDRARPLAAQVEAGNVCMITAPWNDTFINEAAMFPAGRLSDQVDAGSRAYARLIMKRPLRTASAPKIVGD